MNSRTEKNKDPLENVNINIKIKLAGLWTAVMFLYAYADIQHFVLQPGSIKEILEGSIGGMETTPLFMFGAAVLMTYPAVMIFLSLLLRANINRLLNIVCGGLSTLVILTTMLFPDDTWAYYYFYNVFEILITVLIVVHAIKWPKKIYSITSHQQYMIKSESNDGTL